MPVKRQNPPSRSQGRAKGKWGGAYADDAADLMSTPGEWGVLKTFHPNRVNAAKSLYTAIMHGRYRAFRPAGDWDATIATEPDELGNPVVNVYAVYLGGD